MKVAYYVLGALGLALLMIVHELGHFVAARKFGMRVTKFSIGFGPTLWKHKSRTSPTIYQIAIIPFIAYVQIAGMNPWEEIDPKDTGSYANASLWARIVTIAAGPLTNYFFASVLIFAALMIGGKEVPDEASMKVEIIGSGGAAQVGGLLDNDKIVAVDGKPVANWDELKQAIGSHAGDAVDVEIDRGGTSLHKTVTPAPKGDKNEGKIMISPASKTVPVSLGEAAKLSVIEPPLVVYGTIHGIIGLIAGREKADVSGPVGIVRETAKQAELGPDRLLHFLGALSAYLGAFNLLPFPALDGARLLFLGVEAASRRRPDAKFEARVHAFGLLVLLGVIAFFTYLDVTPK